MVAAGLLLLLGVIWDAQVIYQLWGVTGLVVAFLLGPISVLGAPILALVEFDALGPLLLTWGGVLLLWWSRRPATPAGLAFAGSGGAFVVVAVLLGIAAGLPGANAGCEVAMQARLTQALDDLYRRVGAERWPCLANGVWTGCSHSPLVESQRRFADAVERDAARGDPQLAPYLRYIVEVEAPQYRTERSVVGAVWAPAVSQRAIHTARFAALTCNR
jgi:hypothetical protein